MKDEIDRPEYNRFGELKYCINEYMVYLNYKRYQSDFFIIPFNQYNNYRTSTYYT